MPLGTACWALLTASEPPGSQSIPFPLDPLLASKADPPDLPAPPTPGPQLLPSGLEWKGHRSVICSREFSGGRLGPAFSGCYSGIHPAFRTGKARTGLEPANGLGAESFPRSLGRALAHPHRELHPSPTLCHPLPLHGAPSLEPILPWNKQCDLRNHTQACDISEFGVNESICLTTSVWHLWACGV